MGMIGDLATLAVPHVQGDSERAGWDLTGITPGFDKEMTATGVVKGVDEAAYAKALLPDEELMRPRAKNLALRRQALFDLRYPGKVVEEDA